MILTLADVISEEARSRILELIDQAEFVDGRQTAGELLTDSKHNDQIETNDPSLQAITNVLLDSLKSNTAFRDATYPKQLHSVLVSRYRPGMAYGLHVDNRLLQSGMQVLLRHALLGAPH